MSSKTAGSQSEQTKIDKGKNYRAHMSMEAPETPEHASTNTKHLSLYTCFMLPSVRKRDFRTM